MACPHSGADPFEQFICLSFAQGVGDLAARPRVEDTADLLKAEPVKLARRQTDGEPHDIDASEIDLAIWA